MIFRFLTKKLSEEWKRFPFLERQQQKRYNTSELKAMLLVKLANEVLPDRERSERAYPKNRINNY